MRREVLRRNEKRALDGLLWLTELERGVMQMEYRN